ncbi:MAG: flagellar assembly protein FliW [Bryobacterales bacterium]|nr:flagellar assembly protein FliW [Bryobacterales bacterium]
MPAFEDQRHFVIIEREDTQPLVFLQSLDSRDLLFMALPVRTVEPSYQLMPGAEDLEELQLDPERVPEEGKDVITLGFVTVWEDRDATINLMAPVVVNAVTRRALQVVQPWAGYSHQHRLGDKALAGEAAADEAVAR